MHKLSVAQDGRSLVTLAFAALCLVGASEAYRLARRQIQDRLTPRENRRHALVSAIVTYGVGFALSRLAKRFAFTRSI